MLTSWVADCTQHRKVSCQRSKKSVPTRPLLAEFGVNGSHTKRYDVPYNYNDCKPQDSVGEMSIILRVVLRWKSIFSGHVPTQLPVPIRRRVLGLTSMISKAFKIRGKRNRAMVVQTNGASCDRDVFCIKCVVY